MAIASHFFTHYCGDYSWAHWEEFNPFESTSPVAVKYSIGTTSVGIVRHRISPAELRAFLKRTVGATGSSSSGSLARPLPAEREGGLSAFETDAQNSPQALRRLLDLLERLGIFPPRRS